MVKRKRHPQVSACVKACGELEQAEHMRDSPLHNTVVHLVKTHTCYCSVSKDQVFECVCVKGGEGLCGCLTDFFSIRKNKQS